MKKNPVTSFDLATAFKALDELDYPMPKGGIRANKPDLHEVLAKKDLNNLFMEDYYDVNDKEEMEEAQEIRDAEVARAKLARIEKIVDLDAESEDDLLPSYVGKTIIQCPQCMTLFYKKPEDLEASPEDDTIVNIGEACQHCGNDSGYTIIGKVAGLSEEEKTELENEMGISEEETEETNPEESEEKAKDEDNEDETAEEPEEEVPEEPSNDVEDLPKVEEDETEEEEAQESFSRNAASFTLMEDYNATDYYQATVSFVDTEGNDLISRYLILPGQSVDNLVDYLENLGYTEISVTAYDPATTVDISACENSDEAFPIIEAFENDQDLQTLTEEISSFNEDLDYENLIDSADFGPEISDAKAENYFDEIKSWQNNPQTDSDDIPLVTEEINLDTFELDDLDENTLEDNLTQSLTEVYSNVNAFKLSNCKINNHKLFVEGKLKFKSGKTKPITYVFEEAYQQAPINQYSLIGSIKDFNAAPAKITLTGIIQNKSFITENINYKYNINNKLVEGITAKSRNN